MNDFEIFHSCFPEYPVSEEVFHRILRGDSEGIFRTEGGFACVSGNRITLLCVAPEYRGKGEGKRLLRLCEEKIASGGADSAVIGGRMICGAPVESAEFFRRHGYSLGQKYNEMILPLGEHALPEITVPEGAEFRIFDGSTMCLRQAVAEVDEEWVQYFENGGYFYCGYLDGELASFCIIGEDEDCLLSDGINKVGSVGCVGTLPKFRKNGLGLRMVALASEYLREQGCDKIFIHYTHLDKWYAKLGAEVFQCFMTAEKALS